MSMMTLAVRVYWHFLMLSSVPLLCGKEFFWGNTLPFANSVNINSLALYGDFGAIN
jgi:hypothetical protein